MDRMFLDPQTGDMHDERWFRMQDIDLDTVIEAVDMDGNLAFIIIPENVPRMKIRSPKVVELMKQFMFGLINRMDETEDKNEREQLRKVGRDISLLMLFNLAEMKKEQNNEDFH